MRRDYRYYDAFPRLLPAGRQSTITIRPLHTHSAFLSGVSYDVYIYPIAGAPGVPAGSPASKQALQAVDGALRVQHIFAGEQEYALRIERPGQPPVVVAEVRAYALRDDLWQCFPYKGDVHLHSSESDGWESPGYVAAACRRIGLDFMALTDHRRYAPSLEASRAFEGVPLDLRIYPGEEVHPPDCRVHLVNMGGQFSVNELFADRSRYQAETEELARSISPLRAGVDEAEYARCRWALRNIREAGGLAIFCHPYWISAHRYDISEALTEQILADQPFDALELIGGYFRHEQESNALQVARYHEARAQGRIIPIVGASDAHGCERGELFGWYYTVVFASSPELPELIREIKDCHAVAVEAMPGEMPRAHGPFRLVRYAQFLLREVFPLHDELCHEEGQMMLRHLAGDGAAREELARRQGSGARLYQHLWGLGEG